MAPERYRLVTRSDFDGLVCAVLLKQLGLVEDILLVHPKDVQDGQVDIGPRDIATNLPTPPTRTWSSTTTTARPCATPPSPPTTSSTPTRPRPPGWSTSNYGGAERFTDISPDLMRAVDQADLAQYSLQEVLAPRAGCC